jgi:DNA polymerase-3 subunit gamma/tau
MRVLSRTWQMLLKGIAEVQSAGRPIAAAEMVLVRIAYAADLPTPDEVIRSLDGNGASPRPQGGNGGGAANPSAAMPSASAPIAQRMELPRGGGPRASLATATARPASEPAMRAAEPAPSAPALVIGTFEELIALAAEKRDIQTKMALQRDVRLVRCEDGKLEIALEPNAPKTLINDLSRKLQQWTGRPWMVVVSRESGAPTLKSQADARQAALEVGVRADPLVKAVLERFPGAEIVGVRGQKDAPVADMPLPSEGDLPPADDEGFGDNWVRDDD